MIDGRKHGFDLVFLDVDYMIYSRCDDFCFHTSSFNFITSRGKKRLCL